MDEPLFIKIAEFAGERINEMTGYNTAPEQSPILVLNELKAKHHVKSLGFNYGNYNQLEIISFDPDDLQEYLADDETFGERYERLSTYDIHTKEAFEIVAQALVLAGWQAQQLVRLWRMLNEKNIKWTWNNIHATKIIELPERIGRDAETRPNSTLDGL